MAALTMALSWAAPASAATFMTAPPPPTVTRDAPPANVRVAVLLFNFKKQPSEPWTRQSVRELFFGPSGSVASYYAELSEGAMSLSGDVFGYFTIDARRDACRSGEWGTRARAAAGAAGVQLSEYTHVVHIFPYQSKCWWNGRAGGGDDSGGQAGYSWINGLLTLYVSIHELGHNFGSSHAGYLSCTRDGQHVPFSSTCTTYEYGDPFDVMGYGGSRHMQAWRRWQFGFLPSSEVTTVTGSGTYELYAASTGGVGPRLVRIPRPGGTYYYLELRSRFGNFDNFAAEAPVVNGVSLRIAGESPNQTTKLIDTTGDTCTFDDAALGVGQIFRDTINNVEIETLSLGSGQATVRIRLGSGGASPTEPISDAGTVPTGGTLSAVPSVSVTQVTGRLVAVSWEPAAGAVDHYDVYRGDVLVGQTCELRLRNVAVADGTTYLFGVRAVDAEGNAGPMETAVYTTPDYTSPKLPERWTAAVRQSGVAFTWRPASDSHGVAFYRLTRNKALVAEIAGGAATYLDRAAPPGRHRYSLVAFDPSGNASVPIRKWVVVP